MFIGPIWVERHGTGTGDKVAPRRLFELLIEYVPTLDQPYERAANRCQGNLRESVHLNYQTIIIVNSKTLK